MTRSKVFDAARAAFPGCILNEDAAGRITRFAPNPNKPHKKDGYIILFADGAGLIGDFKTGYEEYVAPDRIRLTPAQRRRRLAEAEEERERLRYEQRLSWEKQAEANQALWSSAVEIKRKTPAGRYLEGRGVYFADLYAALRWTPKLAYYEDGQLTGHHPTMVGAVTNVEGVLVAVHRTYLNHFGGKAQVSTPKKLTRASGPVIGCSIKLAAPVQRKGRWCLGVAEGIETALAVRTLNGVPTVSAISAMGLARLVWPARLERIYVFGDNDERQAGQNAARTLATRAQRAGLSAKVFIPENKGEDWADVLEARLEEYA
jgi:putative DNA primase/helicase